MYSYSYLNLVHCAWSGPDIMPGRYKSKTVGIDTARQPVANDRQPLSLPLFMRAFVFIHLYT